MGSLSRRVVVSLSKIKKQEKAHSAQQAILYDLRFGLNDSKTLRPNRPHDYLGTKI
jgi:hypothetical protein